MTIEEFANLFPGDYPEYALSQNQDAVKILECYNGLEEIDEDYRSLMLVQNMNDFKSCNNDVQQTLARRTSDLVYLMFIYAVLSDDIKGFQDFLSQAKETVHIPSSLSHEKNLLYSIHTGATKLKRFGMAYGAEVKYRDYAYILGLAQKLDDWELPHALFQQHLFKVDSLLKASTALTEDRKILAALKDIDPLFVRCYTAEDEEDIVVVVKRVGSGAQDLVYLLEKTGLLEDIATKYPDKDTSKLEKALNIVR